MSLVSGWPSQEIATARQWISTMYSGIEQLRLMLLDAKEAEQYHKDPTSLYVAARNQLISISNDLAQYRKYIITNTGVLENFNYYDLEYGALNKMLDGQATLIVTAGGVTTNEKAEMIIDDKVTEILDGDTIKVGGRTVRIAGTDAPEGGTPRGEVATSFMTKLIPVGTLVRVMIDYNTPYDLYGRVLGVVVRKSDNIDIGLEMIRSCMADVNLKFGKHHYVDPHTYKQAGKLCVMGWPIQGEYKLLSDPGHAMVYIDGVDTGETTPVQLMLLEGLHSIDLVKAGYGTVHDSFVVEPKKVELPSWSMSKLGSELGVVEIRADPTGVGAVVLVNGAVMGASPVIVELPTTEGSNVQVVADGYAVGSAATQAILGRVVRITVHLEPSPNAIPASSLLSSLSTAKYVAPSNKRGVKSSKVSSVSPFSTAPYKLPASQSAAIKGGPVPQVVDYKKLLLQMDQIVPMVEGIAPTPEEEAQLSG